MAFDPILFLRKFEVHQALLFDLTFGSSFIWANHSAGVGRFIWNRSWKLLQPLAPRSTITPNAPKIAYAQIGLHGMHILDFIETKKAELASNETEEQKNSKQLWHLVWKGMCGNVLNNWRKNEKSSSTHVLQWNIFQGLPGASCKATYTNNMFFRRRCYVPIIYLPR